MANLLIDMATVLAMLSVVIAGVRFVLGPSPADRTIALDTLTIVSISLIVLIALFSNRVIYLDVAMVYGILSFIGVIAIARHLEGGL